MKRLGQLAGVPIEPDEQTRLLDECVKVDGVVGGGVPGGERSMFSHVNRVAKLMLTMEPVQLADMMHCSY
jgi:phosphomevalonate kinase